MNMHPATATPLIAPFRALRPVPHSAQAVAAPPYDVLNTEEARALAAGKPASFLHISRPEIDLPADTDPYAPAVYARAAENLQSLIAQRVLMRDVQPGFYVYRMRWRTHEQTGIAAAASVAAYEQGRIKRHELTRADKEDDRVRQITALNAQTGPVLLACPDSAELESLLHAQTQSSPLLQALLPPVIAAPSGDDESTLHQVWPIQDVALIARITEIFAAFPALYIADGHHRSAAAARVAAARRQDVRAPASSEFFLSMIFPARQMQILDYNRLVRDLGGLSESAFLARLAEHWQVQKATALERPARTGECRLYLKGQWWCLTIQPQLVPQGDPVARLDVSLLSDYLLKPLLGIADLRRDKRIDFSGGARGLSELQRRVDSGEMAAAFAMFPTRLSDLMAVADAGEMMPPKSTWFEPKLADGLLSHVLD